MTNKVLIICDSHIGSIKKHLDAFSSQTVYLPILVYKDCISNIVNNKELIFDEDGTYSIPKVLFEKQVSEGKLFPGGLLNFNDFNKVIVCGFFLIDRILTRILVKNAAVFPEIYPNSNREEAFISIFLGHAIIQNMISTSIELPGLQVCRSIAENNGKEILIIPGPPISKMAVKKIFGDEYSEWFNNISFIIKSQRDVLKKEFSEFINIKILDSSIDNVTTRNGFLKEEFSMANGDIHANENYGELIFNQCIKSFI